MPVHLHRHRNACFLCGSTSNAGASVKYSSAIETRCCRKHDYSYFARIEKSHFLQLFVTTFPEPILPAGVSLWEAIPPLLDPADTKGVPDFWTVWPARQDPADFPDPDDSQVPALSPSLMPFDASTIRCGNATYRSIDEPIFLNGLLKGWKLSVLDLSTYNWSHTLKDPRSYAIVNAAAEAGIRHLSLWTAGNAALSLAIAANRHNAVSPLDRSITVHALVNHSTSSSVLHALRVHGVWVTEIGQQRALLADEVFHIVNDRYRRAPGSPGAISRDLHWEVTDGWDGVGTLMYRLLVGQVLREADPDFLVVPCGTGSLAIGAHLALQDRTAYFGGAGDRKQQRECTLVAAVPRGASALRQAMGKHPIQDYSPDEADTSDWPVAPKTAVAHSALQPCIRHLRAGLEKFQDGVLRSDAHSVWFAEVTRAQQLDWSRRLRSWGLMSPKRLVWEPSGIVQYAALENVARALGKKHPPGHVCIVNTGHGLLGGVERAFLDKAD